MDKAEKAIIDELDKIKSTEVKANELKKVQNKVESTLVFSEMNVLNKAMNLAFAELLGNAELVNEEICHYQAVNPSMIKEQANNIFRNTNCSTLYYFSKKK
jgi:zinc protease